MHRGTLRRTLQVIVVFNTLAFFVAWIVLIATRTFERGMLERVVSLP